MYRGCYFGFYDTLKPILLGEDAGVLTFFLLGYRVTISAGLVSYPIDTIRRRMMMTSGESVKYKGSWDCTVQILKNEGFMSMMKGLTSLRLSTSLSVLRRRTVHLINPNCRSPCDELFVCARMTCAVSFDPFPI